MEGYTLKVKSPEKEGICRDVRAGGVDLSIESEKEETGLFHWTSRVLVLI